MSKPYAILVREIDGAIIDREDGHPDLKVELHPIGTELEPDKQSHELHIEIVGGTRSMKTVLDKKGIEELVEFLEMRHPSGAD